MIPRGKQPRRERRYPAGQWWNMGPVVVVPLWLKCRRSSGDPVGASRKGAVNSARAETVVGYIGRRGKTRVPDALRAHGHSVVAEVGTFFETLILTARYS